MHLGQVTMTIVAPTKHPSLDGSKLLVVESLAQDEPDLLAIDTVGAGIGDQVIVATGSHAARVAAGETATDAVIVAIVEPPVAIARPTSERASTESAVAATAPRRISRRPQNPEGKAHG